MKKKILSFLLMVTLLVSVVSVASAVTLEEIIKAQPSYNQVKDTYVDVPTDIEVKISSDSEYVDGPISTSAQRATAIPTFDFQATMYMQVVRDTFDTYITLAKMLAGDDAAMQEELANLPITGEFIVKVYYPNGTVIPAEMLTVGEMVGYNDAAKHAFVDTAREVTTVGDETVLTITIAVKGPQGGTLKEAELEANLEEYLPDLTLTCEGVKVSGFGTHTLRGEVTGYTDLGEGDSKIGTVHYTAVQLLDETENAPESGIDETVIIEKSFSDGGGGGIVVTPTKAPVENVSVEYEVAGVVIKSESGAKPYTTKPSNVAPEAREGYIFDGWYSDPSYTQKVTEDTVVVNGDTVFYGRWINGTVPPAFVTGDTESGEHQAYIIGYPEGDVRPLRNITREEIATVFYRLMNDATRDSIFTADNDFTDVEKDRWSNKAISTLANGTYINGYEDGSFKPAAAITRAEFITIAVRFSPDVEAWENVFTDVDGHWAEEYILKGVALGWITGYEDGSFRPDAYITRAEAMTIFNRVLVRYVNEEGLLPNAKYWIDNPADAWYYYQVEEATNSHTFVRQEDGYNEDWQTIEENQVWVEKGDLEDAE